MALRNLPLEVSTYPVMGEGTAPMGAVVVFEDMTAQRQLAQERRSAEQLQLLTRVVARIADEIKNPLVSINAFMELLGERYDDVSFRQHFTAVVGRDVRRLVQLFDKLAALGPGLRYPHQSEVRGGGGLRELRPRAGRSPWRAFYRQVGRAFVIGAVGPEAQVDNRGFRRAVGVANERLSDIKREGAQGEV